MGTGGGAIEPVTPEHASYDQARLAWNLAADQRPAAVIEAGNADQAREAVEWARGEGLRVACQTTGHMATVLPSLEGTALLRFLPTQDVRVSRQGPTATVPAGADWGRVVDAISPLGLAAMHGSSPSVGVAGYLLGGGLSFYGRSMGFATNHVEAIELVTADGELVRASHEEHPDLFWALRGSGGRYGAVTSIEIGLMELEEVFAGATFWPAAAATEVLQVWRDWTLSAPDSVTTTCRILRLPPLEEVPEPLRGTPVACVDGVALESEAGLELASMLERIPGALMGGWAMQPASAICRLHGDPEDPLPAEGDSILLGRLDDEAIDAFVQAAGEESGSSLIVAELRHLGGALAERPEGSGVLGKVDAEYLLFGTGLADPTTAEATAEDLRRLMAALQPVRTDQTLYGWAEGGCHLDDCFGKDATERLRRVKDLYDPDDVFVAPQDL